MSKLEDLIQKLCPNGVEWKELGEVCEFQNGYAFKSKMFKKSGEKIIRITNIVNGKIEFKDVKYFDKNDYSNSSIDNFIVKKNDILIAMSGATTGKVGINDTENIAYLNQRVGKFIPNKKILNNKFLYHYLLFNESVLYNLSGNGSQENLSTNSIKKLKLPIPPLEIQEKIVHILDSFTELTNELTNELTARKKQYEFYRDKLLTFENFENDNVTDSISKRLELGENVCLKDVATYPKERIESKFLNDETYVGVENLLQDKRGKIKSSCVPSKGSCIKYIDKDILIGNIRPYLKKIWYSNNVGGTNGDVIVVRANNDFIIPRYLYHVLSSEDFFYYDIKFSKGSKMPRGNKDAILNYEFYLPPLSEQERIVNILDKFDKLCNDIREGIPAEIEARQKQYEYYRDKLLTFEPIKTK